MVLVTLKNMIWPARQPSSFASEERRRMFQHRIDVETANAGVANAERDSDQGSESTVTTPLLDKRRSSNPENSSQDSENRPRIDPRIVSDAILGLSDGLTVPFALSAGLSALGDTNVVISGGMAELCAGAISMGIGGWLGAGSEADSYKSLYKSVERQMEVQPERVNALVRSSIRSQFPSLPEKSNEDSGLHVDSLTTQLIERCSKDDVIAFILCCYYNVSAPGDSRGAITSALTIAAGYFFGGFLPLIPYFIVNNIDIALYYSIAVMSVALFVFGVWRTWFTETHDEVDVLTEFDGDGRKRGSARRMALKCSKLAKGGVKMLLCGSLAAAAAVGLVKAFQ